PELFAQPVLPRPIPLAHRAAPVARRLDNSENCCLRSKGAFVQVGQTKPLTCKLAWHNSRAHHQAAIAGRFADSTANAVPTRSPHRATARHPSPDPGLRRPNPFGIYRHAKRCFAEE